MHVRSELGQGGFAGDSRKLERRRDRRPHKVTASTCLWYVRPTTPGLAKILEGVWTGNLISIVELLVPLTWPFDKYNDQMTVNHHRHIPVLQYAQASYKRAILQHPSRKILTNIVRVALPSMAIPASDRTERDEGIIKLVLYFFRNLAAIEHPMPTETDTGEEISRSATIDAIEKQNVLHLLLAMSSEMGSEFNTQDVVVMEVIYHLVKSVDIEKLFMSDEDESRRLAKDLTTLLRMEDDMKRSHSRSASTRHNRFGTTVWLEREVGNFRPMPTAEGCTYMLYRMGDGRLSLGRALYWESQLVFKKWTRQRSGKSLKAPILKAYPERQFPSISNPCFA